MLLKGISFHSELKNIHLNINFYYALLASVYSYVATLASDSLSWSSLWKVCIGSFFFSSHAIVLEQSLIKQNLFYSVKNLDTYSMMIGACSLESYQDKHFYFSSTYYVQILYICYLIFLKVLQTVWQMVKQA